MNSITVVCDRCKKRVQGIQIEHVGTAGFYIVDRGIWSCYANPGEEYLCDECMWNDPRYQRDYNLYKQTIMDFGEDV